MRQLETRMKKLLDICRDRNMKISPSMFQIGSRVTYGGVKLEAARQQGNSRKTV